MAIGDSLLTLSKQWRNRDSPGRAAPVTVGECAYRPNYWPWLPFLHSVAARHAGLIRSRT